MDEGARERCVRTATPWLTALVVLALTVAAAIYVDRTSRTRDQLAFEAAGAYALDLAERRIENFESILQATSALFAASEAVEAGEFDRFVRSLELASRHPGLRGIGYAHREDGQYVVRHLEPASSRDPGRIGTAFANEPNRADAIELALATGRPASTPPVRFRDHDREHMGIVIVVPVYEDGIVPTSEAERRRAATGLVYGRVAAEDLTGGLFGADRLLDVALYEGVEARPDQLVYALDGERPSRHELTRTIDVAGRPWTVVVRSTPELERGRFAAVPAVLAVGSVLALLLFALTRSLALAHARLERTAADLRASEAALRTSEERARALVEQSPLAVQVFRPDGRSIAVNRAWEALFGAQGRETAERPIFEDPQLANAGVSPLVRDAFAGRPHPLPPVSYTPSRGRYAGEPRWIQAYVYPVHADGTVREVVAVYDDVTSRRQVDDVLRDAQRLESLGVLAGGIAHDFNNLLTGVLGYASLGLSEVERGDPLRPMLEQIVSASERAADLTRQLLAYAGRGRYVVERLDLGEIVREVRQLLVTVAPGASVDLDVEGRLDVDGDHGQMHQLVLNLALNAIESYGERPGGVTVHARRVWLDEARIARDFPSFGLVPGAHVAIEVIDRGEGMDAHTLARSFDPFFTTRFMGRGLGLPAALGIVRSHLGGILVRSQPGAGTRVLVVLPAAERAAEEPAIPFLVTGGARVLVVDDEAIVRATARAVLEDHAFDVVEASGGGEAIAIVGEDPSIDVVLLDLSMPGMSGVEALARIREVRPDLPVVVSSGYDEEEALRRFAGFTADGFLRKPYRGRTLLERIARALPRSASPSGEAHPPP